MKVLLINPFVGGTLGGKRFNDYFIVLMEV